MTQYVALLRGINVGGNSKVEMSKLKVCFEKLGYENVRTYINSGNVLFETSEKDEQKIVDAIEKTIKGTFKFAVRVIIRDEKNIKAILKKIPSEWTNDTDQKTDVIFLWNDYDSKKSLKLISAVEGIDTLLYVPGAIVWHIDRKFYNKSGMNKFIGTEIYKNMTARNINTVRKLAGLLER